MQPTVNCRATVRYQNRLLPVLNHIRTHLDEPLQLEQLATISNFSKYHFHRVFKATYGETVHQHIGRLRLEKVLHLLRSSRARTLVDIALETGFSSQASLNRDFKRQFGISSGKARKIFKVNHPRPPKLALPPPSNQQLKLP